MKKLNFLVLCFLSVLTFSSCTKEVGVTSGSTAIENQSNITVSYSEWIPSSMLTWTDTTIDGNPAIHATLSAPLSEAVINNNAVLVYTQKNGGEETSVFPAMIYDPNNDFELLEATYDRSGIQIFHTKNTSGVYARPENNTLRFRYIVVEQPVADNTRPDVAGAPQYTMAELQTMSYSEVLNALGIPE